jgi:hypothetical protein
MCQHICVVPICRRRRAFAVLMILRRFPINPALLILGAGIIGALSFGPP